jgi:hypothetical protein
MSNENINAVLIHNIPGAAIVNTKQEAYPAESDADSE